jgi:hypothetical protein
MLDVRITVGYSSVLADVRLGYNAELDYPLMKIEKVYSLESS